MSDDRTNVRTVRHISAEQVRGLTELGIDRIDPEPVADELIDRVGVLLVPLAADGRPAGVWRCDSMAEARQSAIDACRRGVARIAVTATVAVFELDDDGDAVERKGGRRAEG